VCGVPTKNCARCGSGVTPEMGTKKTRRNASETFSKPFSREGKIKTSLEREAQIIDGVCGGRRLGGKSGSMERNGGTAGEVGVGPVTHA